MPTKIMTSVLQLNDWKPHALVFLPDPSQEIRKALAIISHGYTSHKGSLLTWASRLSDEGIPTILFDQPGHYLGGFTEVEDFEQYKKEAHQLYAVAYYELKRLFCETYPLYEHYFDDNEFKNILCGHSLSALLSIKALDIEPFNNQKSLAICVGLGLNLDSKNHIFQTAFYKSTLNLREQLVSPALNPDNVFTWIGEEKKNIVTSNKRIHFITGEDDIVVGQNGTEAIIEMIKNNNQVTFDKPNSLPHHQPEYAASHIKKFLKKEQLI